MTYFKEDKEKLVCLLCSHYCKLKPDQSGICGVNKNTGDKIECLVYGYPSALNIDPIEKKPLYHFLPSSTSLSLGTIGCNFKCSFCQNWNISQEKEIKSKNYFSPRDIVNTALSNECKSISYTYNEPTIFYPYAKDIATLAKQNGIKNVFVSNGFESNEMINDMKGVIDAVNIDLKTFDEKYYKRSLGGKLDKILENLKLFVKNGIWLEITTLVIPTKNDSKEELNQIASFIANELGTFVPWHISAFHPDYKEQSLPRTPLSTLKLAYKIGNENGLKYVYIGNAAEDNITKCSNCNTDLIVRKYFNTISNNLEIDKCPNCGKKIQGVFK